jgi:two-component system LytT family response regulator
MKPGTRIRVAIIDDEPLGRQKIRRLLKGEEHFEVIGEYDGGEDTVTEIRRLRPDLIFLDIQMPDQDGFALLRRLGPESRPRVIFVTAYDQYALRAFEIHAADYLLKPFDRNRFQQALDRVKETIQSARSNSVDQQLIELLEDLKAGKKFPDRIAVKTGGYVHFVRTNDLNYIEAAGNYVRLHVNAKSYLLRETMNVIQAKLDPRQFVRIHRSTLVNVDAVKELQPWFGGGSVVILNDGTRLNMSRAFRSDLSSTILGNTGSAKSGRDGEE